MDSEFKQKISHAIQLIKDSNYITVLSGAGLSTPSGIPDFRSKKTGQWEFVDPMKVASMSAFLHRPIDFFKWLQPLTEKIYNAKPNPAHQYLTALEEIGKIKAIVTQNIDFLHQKAGSKNVIEVHGSISHLECTICNTKKAYDENEINQFIDNFSIPTCEKCNRYLKPSIVLFEEMLPYQAWNLATNHFEKADLVIVIGSSLEVSPANQLPSIATANGAKLIINTLSTTPLDYEADLILPYDVVKVWNTIGEKLGLQI
ncbi:MAG TPA: NAD-dependent deacylase [Anaerolineaceae bacterium]|nr:NAD-dependent deacylase [Anaerolineaceae bacterium]